MKKLCAIMMGVTLAVSAAACDKKKEGGGDPAGTTGSAPAVEVSPEMKDFLAGMGDSAKVKASLAKHGVEGLATQDMEMYDLKDGAVTAHEKRGAQDCYTFEAKSGATMRTYVTCWEGGKITAVEDKGMK